MTNTLVQRLRDCVAVTFSAGLHGVEADCREAADEIEQLRAAVEEWLCEKCNTVYPGPPQPGFACIQCPKCKGTTAPRQTIELRQMTTQRDHWLEVAREKGEEIEQIGRAHV